MTREEKDLQIKELTQMLADNSVLYLTDATGLNSEETTQYVEHATRMTYVCEL